MYLIIVQLLLVTFSPIYSYGHHEPRNEEFTALGKQILEGEIKVQSSESLKVKVMTYNVLSQQQLEDHLYLYEHHNPSDLSWEIRWPLIFKKIKLEDPQIICMQEVEPMHLSSHFNKLLELGYNYVFEKNSGTHEDGVAVFYKTDRFEVEAESHLKLNKSKQPLTVDKAGVVVRLGVRGAPARSLVVATTHLVFNRHQEDTRLAQMQLILAEIDKLAYNKNSGIYLTEGHLKYEGLSRESLEPSQNGSILTRRLVPCQLGITDSSQYVHVLDARLKEKEITEMSPSKQSENIHGENYDCNKDHRFESGTVSHGYHFRSAYPHKQGDKLEASTNHFNRWITVDYILYSSLQEKEKLSQPLELLSWQRLPTEDELTSHVSYIPDSEHGSDHLPLIATFLLHLNCEKLLMANKLV